jgi:urea transport system permease protein
LIMLGSSMQGIGVPLGSFTVGAYSYSTYRLVLMVAALAILTGLYLAFNMTKF